ncbi:MAG: guanylate kinase [Bacteroidaceae bacterium]|nr:guanylate kinase [Bacteroidaceae bacterium]
MRGKCLIFSAPSGSGKSTIVNHLLQYPELRMSFSVSATSRAPRGQEKDGEAYFFLSADEFRRRIGNGDFLEYEQVYEGLYYGTLKEQVEKLLEQGRNVVFDVDVVGGCNLKKQFGNQALSMFIQPPSIEELERRLRGRATDSEEMIEKRLAKARYELEFAPKFDIIVVNDRLEDACAQAYAAVNSFVN